MAMYIATLSHNRNGNWTPAAVAGKWSKEQILGAFYELTRDRSNPTLTGEVLPDGKKLFKLMADDYRGVFLQE